MRQELKNYQSVAEAISLLLSPHAEVIIHDLESGQIAYIVNNLSKRKIGDESLIEPFDHSQEIFPPYLKTNWDGKTFKSVSALIKDGAGKGVGLLCINLDISKWEEMRSFIDHLIMTNVEKVDLLFKNDWREKINSYVSNYLQKKGLHLASLSRVEKQKLLLELRQEGAFETKNAATYVADVLQISRATVYNYLKESS